MSKMSPLEYGITFLLTFIINFIFKFIIYFIIILVINLILDNYIPLNFIACGIIAASLSALISFVHSLRIN